MKNKLRKKWDGFRMWVKCMKYKSNMDNDFIYDQNLVFANNKIEELKQEIKNREDTILAKENLIKLREEKIKRLTKRILILKRKYEGK